MATTKVCGKCGEPKKLTDSCNDRTRPDGRYAYCRTCTSQRMKAVNAQIRADPVGRAKRRTQSQALRLKTYGFTRSDYDTMFAAQQGRCAICTRPETAKASRSVDAGPRLMAVDHDHGTGKVRGLLCHRRNVALGLLEDDVDRLEAAARYLRRWVQ